MATPDVRPGHYVPVTMNLVAPPIIQSSVQMSNYLSKTTYLYGSDFIEAKAQLDAAMVGRERIPVGWWESHNGKSFVLPYDSKAKLQRATVRSNMDNIHAGYVYPFTTNREHTKIPDTFAFNMANGLFLGLFLAEGNVDLVSGYVQITNQSPAVLTFVREWFEAQGIHSTSSTKTNHIGGTSTAIRGFSTILGAFLTAFVGHGAAHKHVPAEAFAAPEEFLVGLLNGYFSGDGTISHNSVEVGSASVSLIDGISMVCTRLGMFGKVFTSQLTSNNLGTENILPTYRLSLRAQWAVKFAETIPLIDEAKALKLQDLKASEEHRNFKAQNDVVLDKIVEINLVDVAKYPKVYDLTVPSTLNFGLANGLHVVDTADTGYMQRQIRVALEDMITQHDGSVRDAMGNIVQVAYGEDGINATKLELQPLPLANLTDEQIRTEYAAPGALGAEAYLQEAFEDRRILVECVFRGKIQGSVRYPVHIHRLIESLRYSMRLKMNDAPMPFMGEAAVVQAPAGGPIVTASEVLATHARILHTTHKKNRLWGVLVRYHLRPTILAKLGFTKVALDALAEQITLKHWQSWVEPGQPVGVIAAQSIGQPATQMTLNTFHLAGVAAKSNMTRGVPRLKELMKATHNPKAVELTIPLRKALRGKKEEARRVSQLLEFTMLQDIVTVARIYYDPRDAATIVQEDADWLAYMAAFEMVQEPSDAPKSPWILRFELDRDRMFAKNITMDDVAFLLKSKFGDIDSVYTDYNATRLVFRARLVKAENAIDDLNVLKVLQNKILSTTVVRGIPGLRTVNYQKVETLVEYDPAQGKYDKVTQYVLSSDGSNITDVMANPNVDATRVVSSNVHDMYEALGIEATRATFYKEITTLFEESGSTVNYRHVCLLVDAMCHKGKTMSIDRYGINKNNIGPLAKMSFEQTEDIALRAATFGERDPVLGVSAKIMLGAPIKAGTAFSEILFDEEAGIQLATSTPDQLVQPASGPQAYTEEQEQALMYGRDDTGECAIDEVRLQVAVPDHGGNVEEEADVDVEISIV